MSTRDYLIAAGVIEPGGIPARFRVNLGLPVLRIDEHGRRAVKRHLDEGFMSQVPDQISDAPARAKRRKK